MRGKDCACHCLLLPYGITPAYAGKSYAQRNFAHNSWDHPRVCGEKSQSTSASPRALGSPPRMRGKGVKQSNSRIRMGITPAYAGKSKGFGCAATQDWDHPRVCGEKPGTVFSVFSIAGSPPRMRGKEGETPIGETGAGITPAYAGKSCWVVVTPMLPWDHPRVCGEKKCWKLWWINGGGSPPRMRGKD